MMNSNLNEPSRERQITNFKQCFILTQDTLMVLEKLILERNIPRFNEVVFSHRISSWF